MFSQANEIASEYTRPVIISQRFYDKTVECGCGAFVILNKDGWIASVAHILNSFFLHQQHTKEIEAFHKQIDAMKKDPKLNEKQRARMIKRVKTNPKWIVNHSFWWSVDGVELKDVKMIGEADLMVGRLEPFNPTTVKNYPILKNPQTTPVGTSLCKLGFPFHEIKATFDEPTNSFSIAPGVLPLPRFPIEGIYTRNANVGKSKDGKYDIRFLETSSPGLRGQSGGPIFDVKGQIWAIQSHTRHLPLGFSPKVLRDKKEVEENQFLNIGMGVHVDVLVAFLNDNGIQFNLSSE